MLQVLLAVHERIHFCEIGDSHFDEPAFFEWTGGE